MPVTPGGGSGAAPFDVLIGSAASGSPSVNVTSLIDHDAGPLRIEESGTFESASCSFALRDAALAYTAMRGEWHLQVQWHATGEVLFRGLIRQPSRQIVVREHRANIVADDMSVMLDRLVLTSRETRPGGETLKSRIAWLFGSLRNGDGSAWTSARVAQPLFVAGFDYTTFVKQLDTNLPKQGFGAGITLRQALERILSAVSNGTGPNSANYYVAWPYLHVYDDDNPESTFRAPYDIDTTAAPGAGKVAPEDLTVDWDTSRLVNGVIVKGKNAAGSGFYTDQDVLAGPWSVNLFGIRTAALMGPDSDTAAKAQRLARMFLRDTRNPVPRIAWTLSGEAKALNGSTRWQGGQLVYVTSTPHGLNGSGADAGPWAGAVALQPLRVARVTTTLLSGSGERQVEIEAGNRRRRPAAQG